MAPFRDLFHMRSKGDDGPVAQESALASDAPEALTPPSTFKLVRSTTTTEEAISPTSSPSTEPSPPLSNPKHKSRISSHFRRSSNPHTRSPTPSISRTREEQHLAAYQSIPGTAKTPGERGKRLSARLEKLHIRTGSRTISAGSFADSLPDIETGAGEDEDKKIPWVSRAILLAYRTQGMHEINSDGTAAVDRQENSHDDLLQNAGMSSLGTSDGDENAQFQEAIQLHEAGNYKAATALFARLASPTGANNPSAQILYSLSLRHGWGMAPSPSRSIYYLSLAACNAASAETKAIYSYSNSQSISEVPSLLPSTDVTIVRKYKPGPALATLRLALFELGNTFRFGLGMQKDPTAARTYYETAAELGDTDAMTEAAWCFVEGFGGDKDKRRAARLLRMAEGKGVKTVGGSWIWKDKYMNDG